MNPIIVFDRYSGQRLRISNCRLIPQSIYSPTIFPCFFSMVYSGLALTLDLTSRLIWFAVRRRFESPADRPSAIFGSCCTVHTWTSWAGKIPLWRGWRRKQRLQRTRNGVLCLEQCASACSMHAPGTLDHCALRNDVHGQFAAWMEILIGLHDGEHDYLIVRSG